MNQLCPVCRWPMDVLESRYIDEAGNTCERKLCSGCGQQAIVEIIPPKSEVIQPKSEPRQYRYYKPKREKETSDAT